ncbi:Sec-independent protein translocase protein TatB [Pseudonocardia sp. DLS-67]
MFDSIGWGEVLVIAVAGLFILGPERLPGAVEWLGRTIRQVKSYAAGAGAQIRDELGPEFDELRRPAVELRKMRGRDPRRTALDALLKEPEPKIGPDRGRN